VKTLDSYQAEYEAMRAAAVPVKGELLARLITACQKNDWLRVGGLDFEPVGFCREHDYPYCLERYDDVDMLERFFAHVNWAIRAAVQHHDLIFVNQVNAGDEWWTLKIDGDQLVPFESLTWRRIIASGQFEQYMTGMLNATVDECRRGDYLPEQQFGDIVVAKSMAELHQALRS
jgi:hypothetical protein